MQDDKRRCHGVIDPHGLNMPLPMCQRCPRWQPTVPIGINDKFLEPSHYVVISGRTIGCEGFKK